MRTFLQVVPFDFHKVFKRIDRCNILLLSMFSFTLWAFENVFVMYVHPLGAHTYWGHFTWPHVGRRVYMYGDDHVYHDIVQAKTSQRICSGITQQYYLVKEVWSNILL